MLPDPASRLRRAERLFLAELDTLVPYGDVYCDTNRRAAALWSPPGRWRKPLSMTLRIGLLVGARGFSRMVRAGSPIERKHSDRPPHYYLDAIGVDPDTQGSGLGTLVLGPVLRRCDRDGTPAYLESSSEANLPYYQRRGFELLERVEPARGCPPVFTMWREPVRASSA